MDVTEIGLAQKRNQWWAVVNTVMGLRVQYKAENFFSSLVTVSFSRLLLFHGVSYYYSTLSADASNRIVPISFPPPPKILLHSVTDLFFGRPSSSKEKL
jgi:hypothetical protein